MKQLLIEDAQSARNETDPEFTVADLVQVTGLTARDVRRILAAAGVGLLAIRPRMNGGGVGKTWVIRWSQLKGLAKEFGW
jgi:hypothetical protein